MRAAVLLIVPVLLAAPAGAWAGSPNSSAAAAEARNEARWAEWEAQARMTEGDYDGAVQAEAAARAQWQKAEHEEMAAVGPRR